MIPTHSLLPINCDGPQCGWSIAFPGSPEAAAVDLRQRGWQVIGDGALASCYCPECVAKGKGPKE